MYSTSPPSSRWRSPPDGLPLSRFRSTLDVPQTGPVLPCIASLLKGSAKLEEPRKQLQTPASEHQVVDTRKRKLHIDDHRRGPQNYRSVPVPEAEVVMFVKQREEVRSPPPMGWTPLRTSSSPAVSSAMRHAVYREFAPKDLARPATPSPLPSRGHVRPSPDLSGHYVSPRTRPTESTERRLFYQHDLDPHKIHEIHVPAEIPQYREEISRRLSTASRYLRQTTPQQKRPVFYEEEMETNAQKRRRVTPSPTAKPRQRLYESEYGLTVLETSKPFMRSRYSPVGYSEVEAEGRRRYVRGSSGDFAKVNSPVVSSRTKKFNNGGEGEFRATAETKPLTPIGVEKHETTPMATLVLKSKEFLKSKNLVRNRHDEIDWVATFLKVGFDSSSMYALMCPLRKGRWKSEEENYTMGLLRLIENGTILLRHGQSIRGYIGEKLHSDDMRVLKKLSNCKMFHFAKLINPRLAEEEKIDLGVEGAREDLEQLDQLKGEFLRSVQLEALVAVRKYLSDSSLRDLLNIRA